MNTKAAEQDDYYALYEYTMSRDDPSFIHQHIVDAYAAQHAGEETKPIALTFALVWLYLVLVSWGRSDKVRMVGGQRGAIVGAWRTAAGS